MMNVAHLQRVNKGGKNVQQRIYWGCCCFIGSLIVLKTYIHTLTHISFISNWECKKYNETIQYVD